MLHRIRFATVVVLTSSVATISIDAQWIKYPTPGIPRTTDGKPNLSGVWQVNNEANWDLQTHAARPGAVTQRGVYPYAYAEVPAAPVLALGAAAIVAAPSGPRVNARASGEHSRPRGTCALRAHVAEYLKKPISVSELLGVLGRLVPETQRAADIVARVRRYLEEYPPRTFRAAELAGRLGMSETHLRRLFRAVQGQTPRQYLAEVRMRRAADLLRQDGRGVKEVASEIGYTDLRLFRRTFTRLLGMPPASWRWRHQGKRGPALARRP